MTHMELVHTIIALAALASVVAGLLYLKQILLRWGRSPQ